MTLYWLCVLLLCAAWWPRCRELHEKRARMTIIAVLIGAYIASLMPNWYLKGYTLVFLAGLFRVPSPVDRLPLTVYPALLFAALYVLLGQEVAISWLGPVLWSIVACGLILSAWWGVSFWINAGHYDRVLHFKGKTLLHLYEHQPHFNPQPFYCCGQGNVNFAQALAGGACAAAVALVLLGHFWASAAVVVTALPLLKIKGKRTEWGPSQGWGYLVVIGAAVLVLAVPLLLGPTVFLLLLAVWWLWTAKSHLWSGRPLMWAWGLQVWKDMSWLGKLIGAGPESWLHIFQQDAGSGSPRLAGQTAFATHSHNEFVNALVETGVLGTLLIIGYCATTLWGLWLIGSPLLVLGAMLLACMCISFPVSLYHEVMFMDQGDVTGHGMPILNIVALAFVLLAEAVLR